MEDRGGKKHLEPGVYAPQEQTIFKVKTNPSFELMAQAEEIPSRRCDDLDGFAFSRSVTFDGNKAAKRNTHPGTH